MGLAIEVELITPHYPAARFDDRSRAEWPPEPGRLFCALTACHRTPGDVKALERLERLDPPAVHAGEPVEGTQRSAFVVTNRREKAGKHQQHPGRVAQARTWNGTSAPARVVFMWDDAPDDLIEPIDQIARRVPYLGRSTGVALLSATAHTPNGHDGPVVYEPCDMVDAEVDLRVPYPGYLRVLMQLHEDGRPAWEAARAQGYRRGRTPGSDVETDTATVVPSVYDDFLILRFDGLKPDGRLIARFTRALRRRIMSLVPDPLPAALHGHDAPGRPHIAFLGLPTVGAEHSDGHLLGMAIAIPAMAENDRRAVLRTVYQGVGDRPFELEVPGLGAVGLMPTDPLVHRPWGLRPERWRSGSRQWVSATPVVLDRYPKDGDVAAEVVRSCLTVGLPTPDEVEVSTQPLTPGAVALRPGDLPEHLRGRLYRHVRLTFSHHVSGPVLIGAGRYAGIGLLSPETTAKTTAADESETRPAGRR